MYVASNAIAPPWLKPPRTILSEVTPEAIASSISLWMTEQEAWGGGGGGGGEVCVCARDGARSLGSVRVRKSSKPQVVNHCGLLLSLSYV